MLLPTAVEACSFVPGYFHRVTALKGRVVGRNLGLLQFRWLRQLFSAKDATLYIYEYHQRMGVEDLKHPVATAKTDSHGGFDFGALPTGHYLLEIAINGSGVDWFDVEITTKVKRTESVLIDISPIAPDCSGGHEFIEKKT
jgi:hypothetical protein